jgi:PPP family 3-phenylpropionic acid transporter
MYLRLSSFYLVYFATLGALLPYWGLYLKSLGFGATEIGELIAVTMATKMVAPNVWGWVADHTGRRVWVIRVASVIAVVAFSGVFFVHDFWGLAIIVATFSFFWNAALPQFEALTMSYLGDRAHRYSSIRLWGSIGFIATVVLLGPLLDRHGAGLLPCVLVILLGTIVASSLTVPERPLVHESKRDREPFWQIVNQRDVRSLLIVCFLMQASHGPYYSFYSIYLENHGYSHEVIGRLWALGVIAEIIVFLFMHRLLPRFGVRRLLLASLGLATLRWMLIGAFVDSAGVLAFAQLLHAASFGVYHAVAIGLIHGFFTGVHQGRGQAIYSSLSFGAGGAFGSFYAGYLWDSAGASMTFMIAAVASAAAFVFAARGIATGRLAEVAAPP